ncbi:FIG040338: Glycosyl transferase [hydrothermal vent metagenome]|uniref:FIG040338: Glycosyl transferase n=1 Tax=hydrothermal vent metagenome TaxID=652676 RepID=A0A3B0XDW1_9ZZZZ
MTSTQQNTSTDEETLHVLHIASGDLWAGAEVMLYTLTKTLFTALNVRVTVILLNPGTLEKKLQACGITVHIIDESHHNDIRIFQQINKIVSDIKPNVIHTHRTKENILGSIAAWRNNIPSIRTTHGAPEHAASWRQLPKRIIYLLDLFCGRYLQKITVAVSEDLAKKLQKNLPAEKIHVIENGINLQEMNHHATNKKPSDQPRAFNVGFAGRLVPVKRVDIFIKTARHILDHYPELNVVFHIYGDGPLHNELEQLSNKLKTDTIVFFKGHSDNIPKEIQMMDVLLMTSDHEGLPMILLETMALETPIISHAVGGIPQLLNQGSCGILITKNTPANYASAINDLANSPEKTSEITRQARRRVEEKYSAKINAQAYLSQYSAFI